MPDEYPSVINEPLVRRLLGAQFPQWANLPVRAVVRSGWDNRAFRLGDDMLVRLPSGEAYADQVAKEQRWLLKLAPSLPLPIPTPLAQGVPSQEYPWNWSIYRWIEGEPATVERIADLSEFALRLAEFLIALQTIDALEGPRPGAHNFYRGGPLSIYDAQTRQAIALLKNAVDVKAAEEVWNAALATSWQRAPVWIHGDVSASNLLVRDARLTAVIDFGNCGVGDPACDLAIAWTLLKGDSRRAFCDVLSVDEGTCARGRGWTIWKALIVAADLADANPLDVEAAPPQVVINEVLEDHRRCA